jgi:membrane-associated phospholipid phosphatase
MVRAVLRAIDASLLRLLRTRGHSFAAEGAVRRFSRLGEHGAVWLAASGLGAALDPERLPVYARAARLVVAGFLANQLVKLIAPRPRPRLEGLPPLIDTVSDRTYPSAHAATSFAAARALSSVVPPAAIYPLALAMTLSRPYLGVHHPSDALAGAVLGAAVAELVP